MEEQKQTSIHITWLGHACFKVESGGYSIVLDPYADQYVPGYSNIREHANQVLCSHGHTDHNFTDGVTLEPGGVSPFTITTLDTFHDDQQGALRGVNRIHILDAGSLRVAHLGDLGCELEPDQKEALKGLDAVMIPIGGYYTIDAAQAKRLTDEICPKVIIPMHYRGDTFGYDVLGTADAFTDQCEVVVEYPGNTLEITPDTEPHTALLRYIPTE